MLRKNWQGCLAVMELTPAIAGLLLAVAGSVDLPAYAGNETNREIAKSYGLFYLQKRDYPSAILVLGEHVKNDPEDADAWNFLGLVQLKESQIKEAADSFLKAITLASSSDRDIYLYNYADALARLGDVTTAREILGGLRSTPHLSESVDFALERIRPKTPLPDLVIRMPGKWRGSFALTSGYDSNVLLLPESSATAEGTGAASPFLLPMLQIGYTKAYDRRTLNVTGASAFAYQTKASAQTFNSLYSGLGVEAVDNHDERARFHKVFGNQFDLSFLNSNGFQFLNWTDTLKASSVFHHGPRRETQLSLSGGYEKFAVETGDDPNSDRSGFLLRPMIRHKRRLSVFTASLGIAYERHLASGKEYRSGGVVVPAEISHENLWGGIAWNLNAEYGSMSYPESSNKRSDSYLAFGTALTRRLGADWLTSLGYDYRSSSSNEEVAAYKKHMVKLTVSYDLF